MARPLAMDGTLSVCFGQGGNGAIMMASENTMTQALAISLSTRITIHADIYKAIAFIFRTVNESAAFCCASSAAADCT